MKITKVLTAYATQDGDGVNIRRIPGDPIEAERKRRGRQRDLLKRSAGEPIKPVIEELPKMSEQFTAMLRMVLAE